ncbi:hypothetical protein ABFX02_01G023700 [Erythranthe guttata]
MRNCRRTSSYSREEDLHLCHVYLDISRCPIRGAESKGQLWTMIDTEYHSTKPKSITQRRPIRSLCARMRVILAAIDKLKGCIQQVEDLNLVDASEQEILFRARSLLIKDANFKKGFRFDHVWPLLKDIEKYGYEINTNGGGGTVFEFEGQNCNNVPSLSKSHSEDKAPSSSQSISPGLSSSSLNENEENLEGAASQKGAKVTRQSDEEGTKLVDAIREENRELAQMLKEDYECRQKATQVEAQNESKKLAMAEYREDNKILLKDLNSITDLNLRELFVNEQKRILLKRSQQGQGSL